MNNKLEIWDWSLLAVEALALGVFTLYALWPAAPVPPRNQSQAWFGQTSPEHTPLWLAIPKGVWDRSVYRDTIRRP